MVNIFRRHPFRRTSGILLTAIVPFFLTACASGSTPDSSASGSSKSATSGKSVQSSELDSTSFTATVVEGGPSIVAGSKIEVSFVEGRVVVNAGCNTMTGAVSLVDGAVAVEHLASTMMACDPALMAQDVWLSDFLESGPKWAVDGKTLTLDNGTVAITLAEG